MYQQQISESPILSTTYIPHRSQLKDNKQDTFIESIPYNTQKQQHNVPFSHKEIRDQTTDRDRTLH